MRLFAREGVIVGLIDGILVDCSFGLQPLEMIKYSCVARFQCGACTGSQVDPTYFLSRVVGNRKQSKRQGNSGEGTRSGVDLNI